MRRRLFVLAAGGLLVFLVWPYTVTTAWRMYFRRRRTLYERKNLLTGIAEIG